MATWRNAQLGVRLFPLLAGELEVDRIHLEGADVQLIRRADGTANWQGIGEQSNQPPKPATQRHLTIEGIDLRDSHVTFVDEGAPRRIEVSALDLSTDEIAPDQPFTDTKIAGTLHMEDFPAAGVHFELDVPKAMLAQDYSKLAVDEFTVRLGELEAEG